MSLDNAPASTPIYVFSGDQADGYLRVPAGALVGQSGRYLVVDPTGDGIAFAAEPGFSTALAQLTDVEMPSSIPQGAVLRYNDGVWTAEPAVEGGIIARANGAALTTMLGDINFVGQGVKTSVVGGAVVVEIDGYTPPAIVAAGKVIGPYRYWRLLVTATASGSRTSIAELQLLDDRGIDAVTGPPGSSASSSADTTSTADKAFDFNTSTYWRSGTADYGQQYIAYDFGKPVAICQFSVLSSTYAGEAPENFRLQYSSDGLDWTDGYIGTQTNWPVSMTYTFGVQDFSVNNFLDLGDTPKAYPTAGFLVSINPAKDGLTYIDPDLVGRLTLAALDDVSITNPLPTDKQVLTWSDFDKKWVPVTPAVTTIEYLSQLLDVDETRQPQPGQVLTYVNESGGDKWLAVDLPAAGATSLHQLSDVSLPIKLQDGLVLEYNASISAWDAAPAKNSLSQLDDVEIGSAGPQPGQALIFRDGVWQPEDVASATGATSFIQLSDAPQSYTGDAGKAVRVNAAEKGLEFYIPATAFAALSDVALTAPAAFDFLAYENGKWVNLDQRTALLKDPYGAHAFWRVRPTGGTYSSADYAEVAELAFHGAVGGVNLCSGGTPIGTSDPGGGGPSAAFDNNPNTSWFCSQASTATRYVGYQFPAAVRVAEVAIVGDGTFFPSGFFVDYSDDNSTWTTAWQESNVQWPNKTQAFASPTGGLPLRFADFGDGPGSPAGQAGKIITVTADGTAYRLASPTLAALADIDVSTAPADAQALIYSASEGKWKPETLASGGATALSGLSDVDETTAPTDGQALVYSKSEGKWKPETTPAPTTSIAALTDVDESTAPTDGQALIYNASEAKWKPRTLTGATSSSGSATLAGLSDVDEPIEPNDGEVLTFSAAESKWKPLAPATPTTALAGLTDIDESTAPTDGQVLTYSASEQKWKPATAAASAGSTTLAGLTDIDESIAPTDGQVLTYSASESKWKPETSPASTGVSFGVGAPVDGSARKYWRIDSFNDTDGAYISIAELSLASTSGGANLCTGGTALESGHCYGYVAANAFDGNPSTIWAQNPLAGAWVGYAFPSPVYVAEIKITPRTDSGGSTDIAQSPTSFGLSCSKDGVTWTAVQTFTPASWSGLTPQTFEQTAVAPTTVHAVDDVYYDTSTTPYTQYVYYSTGWNKVGSAEVTTLATLADIDESTAPTDGQVLTYSASEQKWKPATPMAGGSSTSAAGATSFYGSGAPGAGAAHKFWRLDSMNSTEGSYASIGELVFAATTGGASLCNGGTPIGSASTAGSDTASEAFDGNSATLWAATLPTPYLAYEFASSVVVGEVRLTPRTDGGPVSQTPSAFTLSYSDDGSTWTAVQSFTASWTTTTAQSFEQTALTAPSYVSGDMYFDTSATPYVEYTYNGAWVRVGGGAGASTLAGLTDIDESTAPTDGQVLTYSASEQKWKPESPATSGGSSGAVSTYTSNTYWNLFDNGGIFSLDETGRALTSNNYSNNWYSIRASKSQPSGKVYYEIKVILGNQHDPMPGVGTAQANLNGYVGQDAYAWGQINTGSIFNNGGAASSGSSFAADDIVGVGVDFADGTINFYKNGVLNGQFTGLTLSAPLFPMMGAQNQSSTVARFNAADMSYLPSGYTAWGLPVSASASSGGSGSTTLATLSDVDESSTPTDGQVLTYSASEGKWKPEAPAAAGDTTLASLSDVDETTPPADGQFLAFSTSGEKWKPVAKPSTALSALTDVDETTAPTDGQVLTFSGGEQKWRPGAITVPSQPVGAHKFWRVIMLSSYGNGNIGLANVEFRTTAGVTQQATGGTVLESDSLGGYPGSNAFDADTTGSFWASNSVGFATYIGYEFATAIAVVELALTNRPAGYGDGPPKDFHVQCSDDGQFWITVAEVSSTTGWADDAQRLFEMPAAYVGSSSSATSSSAAGSTTLAALADIDESTAPTDGQVLTYSASEQKWKPETLSAAASTATSTTLTDYGSHSYWRVFCNGAAADVIALCEVAFASSVGGAQEATGGTAIASSAYSTSYAAANAFDGNTSTIWAAGSAANEWIGYQFASPAKVVEVRLTARADGSYAQAPTGVIIQYSDNGSTWTSAWTPAVAAWTQGEVQTFDAPAAPAQAASTTLAGLTDVDESTAPTDGQVLTYSASEQKWKPQTASTSSSSSSSAAVPTTFGAGVPVAAVAAHAYWRITCKSSSGGNGFVGIAKMTFAASIGGADQCTGGTPFETNGYDALQGGGSQFQPAYAFDNDSSTFWASGASTSTLGYQFASAVTVAELTIMNRPAGHGVVAPSDFTLDYSDDGTTYTTLQEYTTNPSWGDNEVRTFDVTVTGTAVANPVEGQRYVEADCNPSREWVYHNGAWEALGLTVSAPVTYTSSQTQVSTNDETLALFNAAAATTYTIQPNASVSCALGHELPVMQLGSASVSFVAAAGVTLLYAAGLLPATRTQYSMITAIQIATDTWVVTGDMAASS